MKSPEKKISGFSLVEILLILGVITILMGILFPSFRSMRQEAQQDEARWKLEVLKSAVEAYYRHHLDIPQPHPDSITYGLQHTTPIIIREIVKDPYGTFTQTSPNTFGYSQSTDSSKKYYVIWSRGVNGVSEWRWQPNPSSPTEVSVLAGSDDLAVSNLPVKKY